MTKRTRVFLSAAAGVLVIGLGTGLVASYVGLQNLTIIGGDGPAELAYVPADARFLAYANVRDVMDSEVRRKLTELQPNASDGAEKFKEQTGIDLQTDIDYVVAAGPAGSSDQSNDAPPLVLARGRFDEGRLEGLMRERGATVEDYKGSRLIVVEEMKLVVTFPEPGLVAIGTAAAVRSAIDTKATGTDVKGNGELMGLVRDIDDGDVWAVARFDALATSRLPAEVVKRLPPVSWFSVTGFVDSGVQGQLRVEARDEASAQSLREVIQGFMALARLQAGQQALFAEVLNSLQLAGDGKTVSLSFSVPPEMIDALGALRAARPRPLTEPRAPRPEPPAPPAL